MYAMFFNQVKAGPFVAYHNQVWSYRAQTHFSAFSLYSYTSLCIETELCSVYRRKMVEPVLFIIMQINITCVMQSRDCELLRQVCFFFSWQKMIQIRYFPTNGHI